MRNVMLIGGIYHPFEEAAAALAELLAKQDITSVITSDVDEAVEELDTADMFTLYALRHVLCVYLFTVYYQMVGTRGFEPRTP